MREYKKRLLEKKWFFVVICHEIRLFFCLLNL